MNSGLLDLPARGALVLALVVATMTTTLGPAGSTPDRVARVEATDQGAPVVVVRRGGRHAERGVRFRPRARSHAVGFRYYRAKGDRRPHVITLWSPSHRRLAQVVLPRSRATGWRMVRLRRPVAVRPRTHTLSLATPARAAYAVDQGRRRAFVRYKVLGGARGEIRTFPARRVRTRVLVRPVLVARPEPTPPATPPPTTFPDASSTGVPGDVVLKPYAGPRTITTAGTVIDGKQVDGGLTIEAPNVVITRSFVDGNIALSESGSVTISDTTVDGGSFNGSAVGQYNITMRRVEVVGARQSVSCNSNCDIQDSWLHAQYLEPGSDWHGDGFISNGGENMLVRHNTLACDARPTGNGGACSAAVALFGDFAAIQDVTIEANLFTESPAAYCLYGGYDPTKPYGSHPTDVVISSNVFQRGANRKCATFGAVTAVERGGGTVFTDNLWDDGSRVRAP